MPANDKHEAYMIHIDLIPGVREGLVEFCRNLPALICTEENGEETGKPHVHILTILSKPESKQTLINRLKKHFKDTVFEKGTFSHTVWEDYFAPTCDSTITQEDKDLLMAQAVKKGCGNLMRYVCKGPSKTVQTPPIVLYKNTLEDINKHHNDYWIRNAQIVQENKSKDKKKTYNETIVDDIIAELLEEKTPHDAVYNVACNKLIHKFKGKINDHVAFPMIQRIEYAFNPSDVKENFHLRMLKKKSNY